MLVALNPHQMHTLNTAHQSPLLSRWFFACALTVTKWDTAYRSRRQLRSVPTHILNDIGLDPMMAHAEASKPFWQA